MPSTAGLVGSPQYAPAASVPLIKSPSLYLPRPIELPPDIHPLPEDISAYFVYPFTLEPHVFEHSPAHRAQQASSHAAHVAFLLERDEAKRERERRERMRLAPGWQGGMGLVPERKGTAGSAVASAESTAAPRADETVEQEAKELSVEDELRSLMLGGPTVGPASASAESRAVDLARPGPTA